jgi:acyl-CoA reductase-like NAD-dependent aldehyde dehydrogenase
MTDIPAGEVRPIWVDGQWRAPDATEFLDLKSPSRLEPIGRVAICGAADVERAVLAAQLAVTPWARLAPPERAARLVAVGAALRSQQDAIAACLARESGQPLTEARDSVLAVARRFEAVLPSQMPTVDLEATVPQVIAVLTPHTSPLVMLAHFAVPALQAGCTLVVKPPPQAPLSTLMVAGLLAALPAGVFNVVTGDAVTGRALVSHPAVTGMAIAGSAETAATLGELATTLGKRSWIATGSLDAGVVAADADLSCVIPLIVAARFRNGGRSCAALRRLYVEQGRFDDFIMTVHGHIAELEFGDSMDPDTDVGPLVSHQAARRVEDQVGRLLRAGTGLVLGGMRFRPCGLPGYFFQPTILTRGRAQPGALREEILGPVLLVSPVPSVSEGVRQAIEEGPASRVTLFASESTSMVVAATAESPCAYGVPPSEEAVLNSLPMPGIPMPWRRSSPAPAFPYRLLTMATTVAQGDEGA